MAFLSRDNKQRVGTLQFKEELHLNMHWSDTVYINIYIYIYINNPMKVRLQLQNWWLQKKKKIA